MTYEKILSYEDKHLKALLPHYTGQHLLQLGHPLFFSLLASPIPHKICLSPDCQPQAAVSPSISFLQSNYTQLPFPNESINLALLPHTLETINHARHILEEVWRVLSPNGHLILFGLNPLSLWGLYRLCVKSNLALLDGHLYTLQTLCQWLHYLGGHICHLETFLFRPPLQSRLGQLLFAKLAWVERLFPWLCPYLGGIYLIITQKKTRQLSGLSLVWKFPPVMSQTSLAPNTRGVHDGYTVATRDDIY